ncbi:helix-turn-helix domain-containing protein [Actinosynnema sp. NPDC050436]|uniref:TetR/AcrR family transcriptional regulator n=1 Tax=Actinosynnema sp. NPDC050436 TaxID=3155659 RepID=UPI003405E3AE
MRPEVPGSPKSAPGLRADARHNRDRIVDVARELFADRGLDVPMAAVARHAGVGVATLYRRFPTKRTLVTEVFADQFGLCGAAVDEALADPDPWRGFRTAVEKITAMQIADRGFGAAVLAAFPGVVDVAGERRRALAKVAVLISRAKAAGALRADFTPDDLLLLLMANNGIAATSTTAKVAASRRLVAYLLDSFRADRAAPLPPSVRLDVRDAL